MDNDHWTDEDAKHLRDMEDYTQEESERWERPSPTS